MLIPFENKRDLEEIPDNVIAHLDIHPVKRIEEVLTLALQNEPSGMQVVTGNSYLAQNALIKTGLAG